MSTSDGAQKAAAEAKAMNQAKREAMHAAVLKYADGERTREDVMRMSGVGRATIRKLEAAHGLKFGKAR